MEVGIPVVLLFTIIGVLILALIGMLMSKIEGHNTILTNKNEALQQRIEKLEACEKENFALRHNFQDHTKSVMEHIDREIGHIKNLVETKCEIIIKTLQSKN